jgi:hypothetical protein
LAISFLNATLRQQLLANGDRTARGVEIDPPPVVKLFTADANATWLLTELDPAEPTRAFGLCDAGLGSPELGYVCLLELAALRGRFGLPVERAAQFVADRPLSSYAAAVRAARRITV